ncbi:MAG: hypothetical protein PVSMB8_00440 [Vulcanimicrobiaceae bacterium]
MGEQLKISGTVELTPQTVSEGGFPAGTFTTPFTSLPIVKFAGSSFSARPIVNSPGVYIVLPGVGAASPATVTNGTTLYFRSASPMLLRLTVKNPLGADVVESDVGVYGLYVREFPADRYLKLFEIQGSGEIEYLVAGPQ